LESGVQRTEDFNLLFLLPGSKSFHRFLVLLLAITATSVFGQESVVTLAMVSYNQSPARTPAVARNASATSAFPCASAPRLQSRVAVLKPDNQNVTGFSFNSRLEKQNGSNRRDLFQLIHKKLSPNGQTGSWVLVEAGYGQFCQFESGIGKNTAELQRPGFAYVKASFSF
jgi:hypothetical protein